MLAHALRHLPVWLILDVRQKKEMKTWHKVAIGALSVALVGGGILAFAIYRHVTRTIPDCYAQWASAELVIGFRKEKGVMPSSWDDLRPYYPTYSPHHGGLAFDEIRERIRIEFPSLSKLEHDFRNEAPPEIIATVSGIGSHWEGAEPNKLVNYEIRKKENGA